MSLPKWKVTAYVQYTNGPFTTFFESRFIDGGKVNALYNVSGWDLANNHVPSVTYYRHAPDLRHSDRIRHAAAVRCGEQHHRQGAADCARLRRASAAAPAQTNPTLYDVLGRRFTFGLKLHDVT